MITALIIFAFASHVTKRKEFWKSEIVFSIGSFA